MLAFCAFLVHLQSSAVAQIQMRWRTPQSQKTSVGFHSQATEFLGNTLRYPSNRGRR